jgi:hypothetical protein
MMDGRPPRVPEILSIANHNLARAGCWDFALKCSPSVNLARLFFLDLWKSLAL